MSLSRRDWLRQTVTAAAGFCTSGASWADPERTAPANEPVRLGVIGTGVRGKYLIGNLPCAFRVVALCDCATSRMDETLRPKGDFAPLLARFCETDAGTCARYLDYRRLLDRERLDAVVIATPDHHHVLAAMHALQAGLHVYLEKPVSVSIREGRLLADLVRKTGRVLQVGSQQCTMEVNRFACEFVRTGGIGRVTQVDLPNYPGPLAVPALPEEAVPPGLDWDLFCGPTPTRPHNTRLWVKDMFKVDGLLWRGWDLFRDYSGHMMTNWGAHSVDMVQLALGKDDTGPIEIEDRPGKDLRASWKAHWASKSPGPVDDREQRFWPVVMRYADGVELRFVHDPDHVVFHGAKGRLRMRRNFFETDPPDLVKNRPDPKLAEAWKGAGHVARPHLQNWLDSIRTGSVLNAPIEAGHRTATICHLANIARELARPLRWDPKSERFTNDADANALLDRPRRKGFELPV